ncbi:MAG TPA: squalene/phytoene synthase family protein, partial [Caulobacteraceae bacterium]|nr:squalene/phytoene synthase family protein [Caulobacteraceae bacterium]
EDAVIGRLYLSQESLAAAGLTATDPLAVVADPRVNMAAQVIAATARLHYDAADRIMKQARQGDLMAPRLMRAAYGRILERMQAVGWSPPRERISLSKLEKLWVVIRYGLAA